MFGHLDPLSCGLTYFLLSLAGLDFLLFVWNGKGWRVCGRGEGNTDEDAQGSLGPFFDLRSHGLL